MDEQRASKTWMILAIAMTLVSAGLAVTLFVRSPGQPPGQPVSNDAFSPRPTANTSRESSPGAIAGWPAICGASFGEPTADQRSECERAGGRIAPLVTASGVGFQCGCCKESPAGAAMKKSGESGAYHNRCKNERELQVWHCTENGGIAPERRRCETACKDDLCR